MRLGRGLDQQSPIPFPAPGPLNAVEAHRALGYDTVWGETSWTLPRRAREPCLGRPSPKTPEET